MKRNNKSDLNRSTGKLHSTAVIPSKIRDYDNVLSVELDTH